MAWNTPLTFVAGTKHSAAALNAGIRDNLKAIGDPWTPIVPTWTNVTLGTTGLVNSAAYVAAGKWIEVRFILTLGTGGALAGTATLTLPFTAATADVTDIGRARLSHGGSRSHADVVKTSNTTAILDYLNVASLGPALGATVNATGPWTWAAGDSIAGRLVYEAA